MSDLQDALDRISTSFSPPRLSGPDMLVIVEAARKYANLDIEAAAVVLWDAAFPRGVHWRKLLPETREKYLALAAEAFDAALGVTVTEENE